MQTGFTNTEAAKSNTPNAFRFNQEADAPSRASPVEVFGEILA